MRRILIVGGGFAGAQTARSLVRHLPAGWEVVLVSEEASMCFSPMLPEVAGAAVFPEQVAAPLRQLLAVGQAESRFILGRVSTVDLVARKICFSSLRGEEQIGYDHLVLALGTRARLDLLPGMAQHALPLKTVGDALLLRNRVLERLAEMELETQPARRARLGRFLLIGGGFSGVEVAGALACFLRSAARFYPGVDQSLLQVQVVHDGDRLLPELPAGLASAALRSLARRRVEVQLGCRVKAIDTDGAVTVDGDRLSAGTLIATIGTRPNGLIESLGLPLDRGRLVVGPDLRVAGASELWAVGDCACVPNAHDGRPSPPTAQFAVRQGKLLAGDLLSAIAGRPTRAFRYRPRGALAVVGHRDGVADILGVSLTGLPAWLAWRAWYLAQMPTFGRRLRILVEWTWSMAFPLDITHLRFRRSAEQQAEDGPQADSDPVSLVA
jgi:NADH dehydrogenase